MRSYPLKAISPRRRAIGEPLFPDYPSNARSFIALDSKLLPYWHLLYDLCPSLLKLDPPEGLNLFRSFMIWAYRRQPAQDWTFHISVCRWLLASEYAPHVTVEQVESLLSAAAARWVTSDTSLAQGILLACSTRALTLIDWKKQDAALHGDIQVLPPARYDFAWSPLSRAGVAGFHRWLRIAE